MSRRRFSALFSLTLSLFLAEGCVAEQPGSRAASGIGQVTVQEASQLIQTHQGRTDFVIVDVRTPAEFVASHLAGAINVDFRSPDFQTKLARLDRSRNYLVYCRVGHRSGNALPIFKRLGFVSVFDMQGGITEWHKQGFPVEPAPPPGT
jgi:rhodanese-related sulfurtransferase